MVIANEMTCDVYIPHPNMPVMASAVLEQGEGCIG